MSYSMTSMQFQFPIGMRVEVNRPPGYITATYGTEDIEWARTHWSLACNDRYIGVTGVVFAHDAVQGVLVDLRTTIGGHIYFSPTMLRFRSEEAATMPTTTTKKKRARGSRTQEPYYRPEATLTHLEEKIGHRGSVQKRGFKRNLVIMWLRIKTRLPFKPDLWALPSRQARDFYNDRTDQLWKEWATAHPAPACESTGGAPRVPVQRKYAEVTEKEESPFDLTLVVRRHRVV